MKVLGNKYILHIDVFWISTYYMSTLRIPTFRIDINRHQHVTYDVIVKGSLDEGTVPMEWKKDLQ